MTPFYITTPIYYVNDRPHIGHAYSTIAADVLRRFHALRGRPARLLTGTDEHGQKIERRAKELGQDPQSFVDGMAPAFGNTFRTLGCEFHDFIRTTEPRHRRQVQALWNRLWAAGDLYLGEYEGWYSVSSEAYLTEKELLPGNLDPVTKKPVERVREESYFFRLSRFTEPLLAFYEKHPTFVRPESRFNEVKRFVESGLRDLSVSRTSFQWGVPVPNDAKHVMYVWLDALTNYISALGGPEPDSDEEKERFSSYWPPSGEAIHIVGKDILRFHAVYWPAFLMSAGVTPPTQVWAHGWLTVDGEKMSKSTGNFIPPEPIAEAFHRDTLRYYLMREIAFGQDGDFSHDNLLARYHGDLGNGLGNLLNRIVALVVRHLDGNLPPLEPSSFGDSERALSDAASRASRLAEEALLAVAPHRALEALWELVAATNQYVDTSAPWALAKTGRLDDLRRVVSTVASSLESLSVMLWPFMPDKTDALRQQLGLAPVTPQLGASEWPVGLRPASNNGQPRTVSAGEPLFPRFDKKQQQEIFEALKVPSPSVQDPSDSTQSGSGGSASKGRQTAATEKKSKGRAESNGPGQEISFEHFTQIDLRLGKVLSAEVVPKSDKLLRLQVDLGEDAPRQIVAGIRKHYTPEDLVGRQVAVVANLAPRKIFGLESRGMLLAAGDGKNLSLLRPDGSVAPGARIG